MRLVLIILVVAALAGLNYVWVRHHDETKTRQEAVKKQPPANPAPKPAPAPQAPAKPKVSWPPKREELVAVIPQFKELEAQFRSAATRANLQLTDEELFKAMYQGWQALTGRGGTPLSRLEWEMGRFSMDGLTRPFDYKNPGEKEAKFSISRPGDMVYTNSLPPGPEGVAECWEKIEIGRGTETKIVGNMQLMTIGGTKTVWVKLTWSPEDKAWVRKTPSQRRRFFDEYEGKLKAQMQEAHAKASTPPNLEKVTNADALRDAFKPAFEYRFLGQFIKEFRQTPWEGR